VTDACVDVCPKAESRRPFNVDNIRIAKIEGSGVLSSSVLRGMVFGRPTAGTVKHATDCKVAVYVSRPPLLTRSSDTHQLSYRRAATDQQLAGRWLHGVQSTTPPFPPKTPISHIGHPHLCVRRYTADVDYTHTETKGTVLIESAEELKNFSKVLSATRSA